MIKLNLFLTFTFILFLSSNAQIKVTPGGDFAIGQNFIPGGWVKCEINGEQKTALSLKNSQTSPYAWASVSHNIHPEIKNWIVDHNGHNFFVLGNGQVFGDSYWTLSDSSLKTNIRPIPNSIKIIENLKPLTYDFKTTSKSNQPKVDQIGFLAQDLQKIIPQAVKEKDSSGVLTVNYQLFIPLLVDYVQTQNARINSLEEIITACCDQPSSIDNITTSIESKKDTICKHIRFKIIPNPNEGEFDIQSNIPISPKRFIITDLTGKTISNYKIDVLTEKVLHINLAFNPSGVYYVHQLTDGQIISTQKVLIQN